MVVRLGFAGIPAGFYVFGGTSAGAPQWAGVITDLNQLAGRPVGFLNNRLYLLGATGVLSHLTHDVTTGDNGFCFFTTPDGDFACVPGFSAKHGWDLATGWGSPNLGKLLALFDQWDIDDEPRLLGGSLHARCRWRCTARDVRLKAARESDSRAVLIDGLSLRWNRRACGAETSQRLERSYLSGPLGACAPGVSPRSVASDPASGTCNSDQRGRSRVHSRRAQHRPRGEIEAVQDRRLEVGLLLVNFDLEIALTSSGAASAESVGAGACSRCATNTGQRRGVELLGAGDQDDARRPQDGEPEEGKRAGTCDPRHDLSTWRRNAWSFAGWKREIKAPTRGISMRSARRGGGPGAATVATRRAALKRRQERSNTAPIHGPTCGPGRQSRFQGDRHLP